MPPPRSTSYLAAVRQLSTISYVGPVFEPAMRRERWGGWYLYGAAVGPFRSLLYSFFKWWELRYEASLDAEMHVFGEPVPFCNTTIRTNCSMCTAESGQTYMFGDIVIPKADLPLHVRGWEINPSQYAAWVMFFSFIMQAVFLCSLGPLTDYGTRRIWTLRAATLVGSVVVVGSGLATYTGKFVYDGIVAVTAHTSLALALACYLQYLPLLADGSEFVDNARQEDSPEYLSRRLLMTNRLSLYSLAWGATVVLLISATTQLLDFATFESYMINNILLLYSTTTGMCWLVGGLLATASGVGLKARAGRALEPKEFSLVVSWRALWQLFAHSKDHSQALIFLGVNFLYCDIGPAIFLLLLNHAEHNLCRRVDEVTPMYTALAAALLAGCVSSLKLQRATGASEKSMICVHIFALAGLSMWGILGTVRYAVALSELWMVYLFVVVFGLNFGGLLGFSQSLFASMTPRDKEGLFFSMYVLSTTGASITPMIITAFMAGHQGNFLVYGFIVISVILIVAGALVVMFVSPEKGVEQGRGVLVCLEGSVELSQYTASSLALG
mmetsp:Transcript_39858/g.113085  ORF Transcript_39858/g.113085 Transcript_39858/m.113085 type:complete len:555 (-) Transcript_39858:381-2045(-)|eukprot:CAMPEP_0117672408 /NCGR_PEP_ID=MMETSP0804-20121206/13890_1 /TAXON_ID=1074897 /ORGANISM="Tetraselmis astigmatica, Strain CCMP880" /LENGTH=554 /DNA_ID=CAMNT_0005481011 /DNA_START=338 /DNA_END=2002 /DNA_ORIENTATION=-